MRTTRVGAAAARRGFLRRREARALADSAETESAALRSARALFDVAGTTEDSRTLPERLCASIGQSFSFERVAMWRYLEATDEVEPVAARGIRVEELRRLPRPLQAWPILAQAKEAGNAVRVQDADEERAMPAEIVERYGLRAVVAVPLVAVRGCLGFVVADRDRRALELDLAARDALATAGIVAGSLLENALARDDFVRRDALKTSYVALASHELRTAVAAICGAAATMHLREATLQEVQRQELARTLHEQSDRLHRLVNQLLDLSRLEASSLRVQPEPIAVRARIEAIVRAIAVDGTDEVVVAVDPDLRTDTDPDAFDRIVSNLIANALHHGEQPIEVSAAQHDRHFRLVVEDRGRGVPPEFAPHLFERFKRGNTPVPGVVGGAGLGLSIAQAYAHAQGGELLYEDASPHGARFQLVVPRPAERLPRDVG
jgi:signal transduction histidine kinase